MVAFAPSFFVCVYMYHPYYFFTLIYFYYEINGFGFFFSFFLFDFLSRSLLFSCISFYVFAKERTKLCPNLKAIETERPSHFEI